MSTQATVPRIHVWKNKLITVHTTISYSNDNICHFVWFNVKQQATLQNHNVSKEISTLNKYKVEVIKVYWD